jgi:hypothetical protein
MKLESNAGSCSKKGYDPPNDTRTTDCGFQPKEPSRCYYGVMNSKAHYNRRSFYDIVRMRYFGDSGVQIGTGETNRRQVGNWDRKLSHFAPG